MGFVPSVVKKIKKKARIKESGSRSGNGYCLHFCNIGELYDNEMRDLYKGRVKSKDWPLLVCSQNVVVRDKQGRHRLWYVCSEFYS